MLKVALTGGIGTGKSYVLEQFRLRGVPCLDADDIAHSLTAAGTATTSAIAARFGADVVAADGSVDRAKLGPIVFSDPAARRDLDALVHPAVYRAIKDGLRGFETIGASPLAVVDVPLLYESGHAEDFDRVIVTDCPLQLQLARLVERGLSADQARQRIAAQWPTEEKARRASYVIRTDGGLEETNRQVERILDHLRSDAGRG
jgi:dephospho-CoA kinase